jgi:hypothetical protein
MFCAKLWGAEIAALPALGIGVRPDLPWGATATAIDALRHAVYATTASATCEFLGRRCARADR